LKNFMATMIDTLLQKVTEQVKKTMEVVSSMRPLPTFDYVPTARYEPSHRHAPAESLHRSDEVQEIARPRSNRLSREGNHDRSAGGDANRSSRLGGPSAAGDELANSTDASMLYTTHSRCTI